MIRRGCLLSLVAFVLGARPAHAQDLPCGTERPWVLLQTAAFDGPARALFVSQLGAALRARKIELCEGEDARRKPAIAVVDTSPAGTDVVGITVEVRDAVTAKRLARDLALESIPEDGRPLTVALAVDELLRASWAELTIADAPPPARAVPAEVARTITPKQEDEAPGHVVDVGAGAAMEHHGGGLDQWGADALLAYWPSSRVGVDARAGLRSAFPRSAPDGNVRASAFVAAFGPTLALVPRGGATGFDLSARAALTRIAFAAEPLAGGARREDSGVALHVLGAARGSIRIVPSLSAVAEVGLGAPLRSVRADDGAQAVTGLSGVRLSASLGVVGAL